MIPSNPQFMRLKPRQLATEYYFGDLQYWKLPKIAADALEEGYDGPSLRLLAGITSPVLAEMDPKQIDSAFREMGILEAPISRDNARLLLAVQLAEAVVDGTRNIFEAATHLRVHLCESTEPSDELCELWRLAEKSRNAPKRQWPRLKKELHQAFSELLKSHEQD